ncbi:hypothetical protein ADIMK_2168 [Marinobacterium lacunae]|uniref:Uncharacterized protein n=1 Tax=Marinobacterium lacunae TaxID=1232683 RepID=A0A081FYV7_9GAMM|nr:hypothetical protein [Marinobacterium lacunae]KEA63712.1 hypothetical protein ADIMK_2168 [Marinobacterium lacunae]
MNTGLTTQNLLRGLTLVMALSLSACVYGPYESRTRVGVHGYYDTAYDDFYFYPDVSVYFGLNSGRYYYRPHDHWVGVKTLPRTIILKPQNRVTIKKLPRGRPFEYYRDHYDRYRNHRGRDWDSNRYRDGYRSRDGYRDRYRDGYRR